MATSGRKVTMRSWAASIARCICCEFNAKCMNQTSSQRSGSQQNLQIRGRQRNINLHTSVSGESDRSSRRNSICIELQTGPLFCKSRTLWVVSPTKVTSSGGARNTKSRSPERKFVQSNEFHPQRCLAIEKVFFFFRIYEEFYGSVSCVKNSFWGNDGVLMSEILPSDATFDVDCVEKGLMRAKNVDTCWLFC